VPRALGTKKTEGPYLLGRSVYRETQCDARDGGFPLVLLVQAFHVHVDQEGGSISENPVKR
jgi:hypothetical protein